MGTTNTKMLAKRRQQLTQQLIKGLLDERAPKGDTPIPGLLTRALKYIGDELNCGVTDRMDRAVEKIIKLLPYVIAKEKTAPAIQINDNRQIHTGKSTVIAFQHAQEYFEKREKQMGIKLNPNVQEAEVVPPKRIVPPGSGKGKKKKYFENFKPPKPGVIPLEDEDGKETGTKDKKQEAGWSPPLEEEPLDGNPAVETEKGASLGEGEN